MLGHPLSILENLVIYFSRVLRRLRDVGSDEGNLVKVTELHQLALEFLIVDIGLLENLFACQVFYRLSRQSVTLRIFLSRVPRIILLPPIVVFLVSLAFHIGLPLFTLVPSLAFSSAFL